MTIRPPHARPTAFVRWRAALVLVAAIVLVHGLALRSVSQSLPASHAPLATRTLLTRTVEIRPSASTATALPARPVTPVPVPLPVPVKVPAPKPPAAPVQAARVPTDGVLSAAGQPPDPSSPTRDDSPPGLMEPAGDPPLAAVEPEQPSVLPPVAPEPTTGTAMDPALAASAVAAELPATAAASPARALASAASAPLRALALPGSVRLGFDALGKRGRLEYKAMGSLTWIQDGTHYDMRLEMGDWIIGKRIWSSTGDLTASGLAPTRFSDKFRSERAAHFDRQRGLITFSANTPPVELLAGAQDRLSIFAQLAALVGGDASAFAIGATVTIQTAGSRHAEPWLFAVQREELLFLPGGQVPTLKLVRLPSKDYDQTVELWLAPELAYLPARIKLTFANGDFLDQQWASTRSP